jgi:hypothetical protein
MGSDVVIEAVPLLQLPIAPFQRDVEFFALVKLFPVCPIRSLREPLQEAAPGV